MKLLSAGAVKRGVARVVAAFEQDAGVKVVIEFVPVPELRRRVGGGEAADVVVATPAALDEMAAQNKINIASRGFLGRSRVGIVIHADAALPAVADVESFKKLLLDASHVVRNEASSGIYVEKLLEKLGLVEALRPKLIITKTGSAIMQAVADHRAILRALRAGDGDAAHARLTAHLGRNRGLARTIAQRHPDYFD